MGSNNNNRPTHSLNEKYATGKKISKSLTKTNTHPFRKGNIKK